MRNRPCFFQNIASCQAGLNLISALPSGVYTLTVNSNSFPSWCQLYNGAMYTLLMKLDGTKSTFQYYSSYWTTQSAYNTGAYSSGLDSSEYQSPL